MNELGGLLCVLSDLNAGVIFGFLSIVVGLGDSFQCRISLLLECLKLFT